MLKVPNIQKPVHWFAEQMNRLVTIMIAISFMKVLRAFLMIYERLFIGTIAIVMNYFDGTNYDQEVKFI